MKIFDVEDDMVKVNENCLLIPELKALIKEYEDPIPALSYVHLMTHPDSPYFNLEANEKQNMISKAVGGDFSFDDEVLVQAIEYCEKLYHTPIQDYYEGQKNSMHVVGRMLKNLTTEGITTGRDGNLGEIVRMQKEAGKTMESFLKLEKLWREQVQQKLRGSAELGSY